MWIFKSKQKSKKIKLGLALGGGGTKGFGHLGVVKAFEEAGISFDYVAGTSAGSIMGALYASGLKYADMVELSRLIDEKQIRSSKLFFVASESANIERLMINFIGSMEFKDLKLPFSCVAVDMITAEEVILNSGSVARAVSASCAVPLFFTPVKDGNMNLVDGGLLNNVPADVVRNMGAEYVVAVDLGGGRNPGTSSTKLHDVIWSTWSIALKSTSAKGTLYSDTIIRPDMSGFKSTKLIGTEKMIEQGYVAAKEQIPKIVEDIKNGNLSFNLR